MDSCIFQLYHSDLGPVTRKKKKLRFSFRGCGLRAKGILPNVFYRSRTEFKERRIQGFALRVSYVRLIDFCITHLGD